MKNTIICIVAAILIGLVSCGKKIHEPETPSLKTIVLKPLILTGVTVENGMPRYADASTYRATYDLLEERYMSNLASLEGIYKDTTVSDSTQDYVDLAWTVWSHMHDPLVEFEDFLGFNSYREYKDQLYETWLKKQSGSTLDIASFPAYLPISPVAAAMMNSDGNYMIGDDVFHLMSVSGGIGVVKILGRDHWNYVDSLPDLELIPMRSLVDRLQDWRNNDVSFFQLPFPGDETDCKNNLVSQDWVQVDDKTKYLAQHAFYYDIEKTSACFQIAAFARVKLLFVHVWIPALTNIRAGMQRFDYSSSCDDFQGVYLDGTTIWGPQNYAQNNNWVSNRKIKKPLQPGGIPSEGFWGKGWVKYMSAYTWTSLHW